jgi:hypothetical protein
LQLTGTLERQTWIFTAAVLTLYSAWFAYISLYYFPLDRNFDSYAINVQVIESREKGDDNEVEDSCDAVRVSVLVCAVTTTLSSK